VRLDHLLSMESLSAARQDDLTETC
jgi:hypothetical protein